MFTAATFTMAQNWKWPKYQENWKKKKLNCRIFAQWNTAQEQK